MSTKLRSEATLLWINKQKPAIEKAEAERQKNSLDIIRDDSDLDRSAPAYVFTNAADDNITPITVSD